MTNKVGLYTYNEQGVLGVALSAKEQAIAHASHNVGRVHLHQGKGGTMQHTAPSVPRRVLV